MYDQENGANRIMNKFATSQRISIANGNNIKRATYSISGFIWFLIRISVCATLTQLTLTICFSVYLFEESRLTASMWPKSMSCPNKKMKSNLQTYFFFWYPSNVLSPAKEQKLCCDVLTFTDVSWQIALLPCFRIFFFFFAPMGGFLFDARTLVLNTMQCRNFHSHVNVL